MLSPIKGSLSVLLSRLAMHLLSLGTEKFGKNCSHIKMNFNSLIEYFP